MADVSGSFASVLKLVAVIIIFAVGAYYVIEKWNAFDRLNSWFTNKLSSSSTVTSAVLSVVYQPVVGAGINQSYGLLKLATNSFIKYRLTISPQSCLSFDANASSYVVENLTDSTVDIPVYFHYSATCNNYVYKVTLWVFSQKEGKFIKGQSVEVVPKFNFANVVMVIPDSGMDTVFQTDLKDLAGSQILNDYADHLSELKDRGVIIISNVNFPIVLKFTSDGDKIIIASNKRSNTVTVPPDGNYTLAPGEVIVALPVKNGGSMLSYYVNFKVGVVFGGQYKDFANLVMKILPPTGLVGVAFQNTTFLIPVSRTKDYFLGHISYSADYVEDVFDFKVFSMVPDFTALTGGLSSDWTVVKHSQGSNWVSSVYAYKPDLDKYGISREYVAQKIVYDGSTVESDGTLVYNYNVKTFMYFNEDSNLSVFASTVTNPGGANTWFNAIQHSLLVSLFTRSDWPKDRAMMITVPTFLIGVAKGVYDVKKVSSSIDVGEYSYRIWKVPDNVSGLWVYNYPLLTERKEYYPDTRAYTYVGDGQVVWKLLLRGAEKGYYQIAPNAFISSNDFAIYFNDFDNFVSDYDVGQIGEKCSLIDRVKNFQLGIQQLGCYQQDGSPTTMSAGGNTLYVVAPVKLMLAYHDDEPDDTTGIFGHYCRGAGGVMLEREDMMSLLAPWTMYWCKAGHDGWDGKKANSILNVEVKFKVKVDIVASLNGLYDQKIEYDINYDLVVYLPLLKPYWDSNYLLAVAMNKG